MSKKTIFQKKLGLNTDGIRQTRIELIEKQTSNSLDKKIQSLEDEVIEKRLELDRLLDLAPDSTDSLRPGGLNYKPSDFLDQVFKLKKSIKLLEEVDIKILKEIKEELFAEVPEEEDKDKKE